MSETITKIDKIRDEITIKRLRFISVFERKQNNLKNQVNIQVFQARSKSLEVILACFNTF